MEEKILGAVGLGREEQQAVSDEMLLALAREAMKRSYSPYSHYPVGAALLSAGLIEGSESEYGLFVTKVDGIEADSANEEWWCLTKGGETVMTGVDSTPVADGDKFEFTLTVGY